MDARFIKTFEPQRWKSSVWYACMFMMLAYLYNQQVKFIAILFLISFLAALALLLVDISRIGIKQLFRNVIKEKKPRLLSLLSFLWVVLLILVDIIPSSFHPVISWLLTGFGISMFFLIPYIKNQN